MNEATRRLEIRLGVKRPGESWHQLEGSKTHEVEVCEDAAEGQCVTLDFGRFEMTEDVEDCHFHCGFFLNGKQIRHMNANMILNSKIATRGNILCCSISFELRDLALLVNDELPQSWSHVNRQREHAL